MLTAKIIKTQ